MKAKPDRDRLNGPASHPRVHHWIALALLATVALVVTGAGPPEVKRVRVPSAKVRAWFPAESELAGMPLDEFEALVRSAGQGAERLALRREPRLLRARHEVRWESGALIGRSELQVEGVAGLATTLALSPWSPAIDPSSPSAPALRIGDDGQTALRIDPGELTSTITLDWDLRGRPGSDGRGFGLDLPHCEVSSLSLDLPADWFPESPRGLRQGPDPGTAADRRSWRFDGSGGPVNLRLRSKGADAGIGSPPSTRVEGTTWIDVAESGATWRADWRVDPGNERVRQFGVELDPGLKLIDVTGPGVASFRIETAGETTRLSISLAVDVEGPTPVAIRARAAVPDEGPWSIPAARPFDAQWTGGRTAIHLGHGRILETCRERAGRRVTPLFEERDAAPGTGTLLVFEGTAPRSVADLTLRKPWSDVSAEVQGVLLLRRDRTQLEARVAWTIHRGRLADLVVDLPPGWTPDRVQAASSGEETVWQGEHLQDGGTRLFAHAPPSTDPTLAPTLTLSARAAGPGQFGSRDLPRIRPVGVRIADEVWTARVEPGTLVRPTSARGLAWLDPSAVATDWAVAAPLELGQALAWRWIEDDAEGRIQWSRLPAPSTGETQVVAVVGPERLQADWLVTLHRPEGDERTLAVLTSEDVGDTPEWRIVGGDSGPPISARPLDAARRTALGFPAEGLAWELSLPRSIRGRVTLHARIERPWRGQGGIPLIALPEHFHARGTVLVAVDRTLLSTAKTEGLRTLDPPLAWRMASPVPGDPLNNLDPGRPCRAHAFRFDGPRPGRLSLQTERLGPATAGALISEALLTTDATLPGLREHHLVLMLMPESARTLEVRLPDGSTLRRVRRNGRETTPIQAGETLRIPLPEPSAARPTCTITLDYQTTAATVDVEPDRPRFSMPCLAFTWNVAVADANGADSRGPVLVNADPGVLPDDPAAPPARRVPGDWPDLNRRPRRLSSPAALWRELDARVRATPTRETTLGELLARWDSGRLPLIVDRVALASAGWGPRSRYLPPRLDPRTIDAVRACLSPLGLTTRPLGNVLLVSSAKEAEAIARRFEDGQGVGLALATALTCGSDPSDRLQSVARWQDEPTPEPPTNGPVIDAPLAEGRRMLHSVAAGWPETGTGIRLFDPSSRTAWRWAAALAVLTLGFLTHRIPARPRAFGAALLLTLALATTARAAPRLASLGIGVVCGSVATLAFWVGQALRPPANLAGSRRSRSSRRRRKSGSSIVAPLITLVISMNLAVAIAADAGDEAAKPDARTALETGPGLAEHPKNAAARDRPIIVLLPYDDVSELQLKGTRVVLLEADVTRLRALAEATPEPLGVEPAASGAEHRVRLEDNERAVIESKFDLWLERDEPAAWTLPVGQGHDLSARVDGDAVPIRIEPGGALASVSVSGAGRHRLEVRRGVDLGPDQALDLPINAVATALVEIDVPGESVRLELPCSRGRWGLRDGRIKGGLGPVDRLLIRWGTALDADARTPRGSVKGQVLWDAWPAGDRVQARLSYHDQAGTSRVRLAPGPGWIIRSASIPGAGVVDAAWQGTPDRPEWVAHLEPPLADGETLQLELWRAAAATARNADEPGRRAPRIEPLGVEHATISLGLRRPAAWSGRLLPPAGGEPLADAEFVRAWGPLPADNLTMAGAVQSARPIELEVSLRPPTDQPSARTALRLDLLPGRIAVHSETKLTAKSGRIDEAVVKVPIEWTPITVEAEGLTDWSRPSPDLVRLRFDDDGASVLERIVRLEGWLPVPTKPLAIGVARLTRDVPWPIWLDTVEEPGTLTVAAPPATSIRLDAGAGVAPMARVEPSNAAKGSPVRLGYQVHRPGAIGRLRWTSGPTKVTASVRSLLTIHPDSVEWTASVRYQVAAGASDTIELSLPREWADAASLEVPGGGYHETIGIDGDRVIWGLRLDEPIWDSRQVLIRSERPRRPCEPIDYPRLVPLGFGSAETLLAWVDASGFALQAAGTSGLKQVDSARFSTEEWPVPVPPGRVVYQVQDQRWSLQIHDPDHDSAEAHLRATRIVNARLECTLTPDGVSWGRALYECDSRPGPFLRLRLPEGLDPLAALLDGRPIQPLRGSGGRLFLPILDGNACRMELVWRSSPGGADRGELEGEGQEVPLPILEQPDVPTLLTVYAPETLLISTPTRALTPIAADLLELEQAEWQAERITRLAGHFDPASASDQAVLLTACMQFELQARATRRAAFARLAASSASSQHTVQRLAAAQSKFDAALVAAGLGEFPRSARARLGGDEPDPFGANLPDLDPPSTLRVRRQGVARSFRKASTTDSQPLKLQWSPRPAPDPWRRTEVWILALVGPGLLVGLPALAGPNGIGRPARLAILAGLTALAAALIPGVETSVVVAVLSLVGVGRFTRP